MGGSKIEIGEMFPVQYDAPRCFACGPENPSGIKLRFKKESENSVSTIFYPPGDWTGWGDILHGGFQALLLDETMAWTAYGILGVDAFVTKDIKLNFHRPIDIDQELIITGSIAGDDGKVIKAIGEIRDLKSEILTSAETAIVRVDPKILQSKKGVQL
ncbi:PaaI family thioesterase [Spirochaetota bacterium]